MKNHSVLEVDLVHVREYNQELGDALESRPAEVLPLVSNMPAQPQQQHSNTPAQAADKRSSAAQAVSSKRQTHALLRRICAALTCTGVCAV